MKQVMLKDVKPGDYFKRKADARAVYIKEHYCRSDKVYCCSDTDNINREVFLKGTTKVFIDFTF